MSRCKRSGAVIMLRRIVYILLMAALSLSFMSCNVKARLRKADKQYEQGEYYSASELYRKNQRRIPMKNKSWRAEVNFKMGECYRIMNNHQRAVRTYTSAIRYKYPDSTVYLNLAKSLHGCGRYKDAAKRYEEYLKWKPYDEEALNGLSAMDSIAEWKKVKSRYKVTAAKEFNSRRNSDFCPMLVGDGSNIYITSNRENKTNRRTSAITGVTNNDVYTARKNNSGKWEELKPVEGAVNSAEDEGVTSFTTDGKTMYFTRCEDDNVAGQILQSQRAGGEWAEPTLVNLFADSTVTVGHPAISPDGMTLYFASDAPGGYGGKDLWMSTLEGGKWTVPENLGASINTSGDEVFPYVRADGTLFFSSDGLPGYGGLDIFMATRDSLGLWKVENMREPINSYEDDFGITFEGSSGNGYFSSNRKQRKFIDRIYRVELLPLVYAIEGLVTDFEGEPLGESTIRLVGDNGDIVKIRSQKNGSYRINLSRDVRYVMMASHRGYLNSSYKLETNDLTDSKIYENNFVLASVNKSVKMDNIFYEFAKWTLTPDSEEGLNELIKMLNDNPNITIEISAHTDMVGSDVANRILSQKRAQSVVNYLIAAGIDKERVTPVGYGETMPVVVDDAVEKQYDFLKTGDVLTPEFIETLPEEQQEVCNQLNRRTEFKVLKTTYNLY